MFETIEIYYYHNVNQELDHPNNYINETIFSRKIFQKNELTDNALVLLVMD